MLSLVRGFRQVMGSWFKYILYHRYLMSLSRLSASSWKWKVEEAVWTCRFSCTIARETLVSHWRSELKSDWIRKFGLFEPGYYESLLVGADLS